MKNNFEQKNNAFPTCVICACKAKIPSGSEWKCVCWHTQQLSSANVWSTQCLISYIWVPRLSLLGNHSSGVFSSSQLAACGSLVLFKDAGATALVVACMGSPGPPYSGLSLARAEAQVLKSIQNTIKAEDNFWLHREKYRYSEASTFCSLWKIFL